MEINRDLDKIDPSVLLLQNAKELLQKYTSNEKFPDENELEDLSDRLIKLQQIKQDIKGNFTTEGTRLMFYQYLLQDPNTWCTLQEADKEFKETAERCLQIKEKIGEERSQIDALLELAEGGYSLLHKNTEDLENKISELEEKIKRGENVKKQYEEKMVAFGRSFPASLSIEQIKFQKKEQIARLDTEIQNGKLAQEALQTQIQNYKDLIHTISNRLKNERSEKLKMKKENEVQNYMAKEELNNLRTLLREVGRLSGIEECPAAHNQIKIKFINTTQTDSPLYLTMTLYEGHGGHVRIGKSEVNVDTLHCSDLIEDAIRTNDVKSLITQLRDRWNMFYPVMTEIERVSEHHAVDWIQDEGLVRVLVGKGGTVMFTLKMPPGYPFTGKITVAGASGLPTNTSLEESMPPAGTRRLKEWVDFLEEKFGKP